MSDDAEDIADIMQGIAHAAKDIIFIQIDFVIHDRPVKLTILSFLESLSTASQFVTSGLLL